MLLTEISALEKFSVTNRHHKIAFCSELKKQVFTDGPDNASYYTADGCGVAITGGEYHSAYLQMWTMSLDTFCQANHVAAILYAVLLWGISFM